MEILNSISSDAFNDRLFINSAFFIFFAEKKIHKEIKNGRTCSEVLDTFRTTINYMLLQDIYKYRVLSDGNDETKSRLGIFTNVFRVKLNNWWRTNVTKEKEKAKAEA